MLFLIPARRDSKGLPYKNRKLLDFTLSTIPEEFLISTHVSTNDRYIIDSVKHKCNVHERSEESSRDNSSTLSLVKEFAKDLSLSQDEIIVMLYLTYPERTFDDISEIYDFFRNNDLKSLLCRKNPPSSPFLYLYDSGDGRGKQIIKHNLYRRQDYPKVFELSHYVSIFRVSEIDKLNNNLYNEDTYFYAIDNKIDVDEKEDLERFLRNEQN